MTRDALPSPGAPTAIVVPSALTATADPNWSPSPGIGAFTKPTWVNVDAAADAAAGDSALPHPTRTTDERTASPDDGTAHEHSQTQLPTPDVIRAPAPKSGCSRAVDCRERAA